MQTQNNCKRLLMNCVLKSHYINTYGFIAGKSFQVITTNFQIKLKGIQTETGMLCTNVSVGSRTFVPFFLSFGIPRITIQRVGHQAPWGFFCEIPSHKGIIIWETVVDGYYVSHWVNKVPNMAVFGEFT